MSVYAMESALWKLSSSDRELARYRSDPDAYLTDFALTDEERVLLKAFRVRQMAAHGVNGMLLMSAFLAHYGHDQIPEYLRRMNGEE